LLDCRQSTTTSRRSSGRDIGNRLCCGRTVRVDNPKREDRQMAEGKKQGGMGGKRGGAKKAAKKKK
jgi:hypothetical protein